ncbi:MAG: glycoside hydrolase family 88 protein, partial [Anaeroplasmataceae bacterium]|nr:glycoside hydrolase family 88 protein [Anaeroplasmataceae bacterium]
MKEIAVIESYIKRLIEESSPQNPIWNVEILKGKAPSWNYIDGCMLSSLLELYKLRKDKKYLDFVIFYTNYFIQEDGTINTFDPKEFSLDDLS